MKVGCLRLRNRIVMPPMATNYANGNGEVTEKLLNFYAARSQDLGLMIVEHSYIEPVGKASSNQIGAHSDDLIPGLARLVDIVHDNETPIVLQLNHGGGTTKREVTDTMPVAPSALVHPIRGMEIPHELTLEEIDDLIVSYADAARRAKDAGFDAVEIHGAHGYLLCQFLSPATNKRRDEYGGDLRSRARLPCKIIEAVKQNLGRAFPVIYRIGVTDLYPGGLTLKEGVEATRLLAEKGVDIIDVSGGLCGSTPKRLSGPGFFVPHAKAVKNVVDIPVIGIGGIKTASEANDIIESGKVDLVAVGRAMLREAKWATKAVEELSGSVLFE
ncbi:MAG: NADH:flavin oxidoreductase [Candidatus Bathyarchaeota archaeon]|nr:NADH:flavin oxidoreductase [Candidatus Bathyarchaeota archaeon]